VASSPPLSIFRLVAASDLYLYYGVQVTKSPVRILAAFDDLWRAKYVRTRRLFAPDLAGLCM